MTEHKVGTREEWLAARRDLQERETELAELGKELAQQRRELPWVPVDKEYTFDTDEGTKTLAELFDGRSQLLAYHIMFGPMSSKHPAAAPRAKEQPLADLEAAVRIGSPK